MSEPKQKPGRSKQDYGTPPEFLSAVKSLLGIDAFTLDVAASAENAVAPLWYDITANGLTSAWAQRGWNYLNPPFGNIAPWVARAAAEKRRFGHETAVLIPASVGSNWWRDHVHDKACVLLLNGRIQFVGATDPYPRDLALLLYSPERPWLPEYRVWRWKDALKVAA